MAGKEARPPGDWDDDKGGGSQGEDGEDQIVEPEEPKADGPIGGPASQH